MYIHTILWSWDVGEDSLVDAFMFSAAFNCSATFRLKPALFIFTFSLHFLKVSLLLHYVIIEILFYWWTFLKKCLCKQRRNQQILSLFCFCWQKHSSKVVVLMAERWKSLCLNRNSGPSHISATLCSQVEPHIIISAYVADSEPRVCFLLSVLQKWECRRSIGSLLAFFF